MSGCNESVLSGLDGKQVGTKDRSKGFIDVKAMMAVHLNIVFWSLQEIITVWKRI